MWLPAVCVAAVLSTGAQADVEYRGPSVALVPRALATAVDPCPESDRTKLGRWLPLPAAGTGASGLMGPKVRSGWTGRRFVMELDAERIGWDPCQEAWSAAGSDALPPDRVVPAGAYDAGGGVIVLPRIEQAPGGACEAFGGAEVTLAGGRIMTASAAGAPAPRFLQAVAATGRHLVVFGGMGMGSSVLGDGAVLDLTTNRWRPLPTAGAPSRRYRPFVAVVAGRVFIWGGEDDNGQGVQTTLGDGALFDPAKLRWTPVASVGAPSARVNVGHTAFIRTVGKYIQMAGGQLRGPQDQSVYLYDPGRGRWSTLQPPDNCQWWTHAWGLRDGRALLVAAWNQHVVLVDPAARALTAVEVPEPLRGRSAVAVGWTGSRLIMWGGATIDTSYRQPEHVEGQPYGFPLPPPVVHHADGWSYAPR